MGEDNARPCGLQRLGNRRHAEIGIDRHALAREAFEPLRKGAAVPHAYRIAEVLGELWRDFLRRDEQLGAAILVGDHIRQRYRGVRDIGTADVEQPCNRIERRDHHGIMALFAQPIGDLGALVGA